MKNKASLVLIEQLIMTLVFALAAAVCLQIFVKADSISRQTERLGQVQVLAQNGAEAIKAADGDLAQAAKLLGASLDEQTLLLEKEDLVLTVSVIPSSVAGLGQAQITVSYEDVPLLELVTGWQEVGP